MSWTEDLARLHALHQQAALTDEEFARAKQRLIGGQGEGADVLRGNINALRRSRGDRWLGGVCGGLGEATGVAPWAWRLGFALLLLFGGAGLVAYMLLWLLVPAG